MKENNDYVLIQNNSSDIVISFREKRFTVKHLSQVADTFYSTIFLQKNSINKRIIFDLSSLEWVGHEELVFLSALFYHLLIKKYRFFIQLKGTKKNSKRQALQIIQLWENWCIHSFVHENEQGFRDLDKYFDIDNNYIEYLKREILEHKQSIEKKTFYGFSNITPFYPFKILPKTNEKLLSQELEEIHLLDEHAVNLLSKYQSDTPFLNKTLSLIISKELFENSIEHAFTKDDSYKECYFGISLKNKILEDGRSEKDIESINKKNFLYEGIEESINFFKEEGKFLNRSILQYTFLDFGAGIPDTLKNDYDVSCLKSNVKESFNQLHSSQIEDTKILEYAFNYSSSRHEIDEKFLNRESIPRGLYDLLSIVKRYKGIVIARSNYGKILFDFSSGKTIKNAVQYFEKNIKTFFPGTIITLFIPESNKDISLKSIKPDPVINISGEQTYYLSIQKLRKDTEKKLEKNLDQSDYKSKLYNEIFKKLSNFLDEKQGEKSIIYIDFQDSRLDYRIFKKILLFLASDYRINPSTNAIIINPPEKEIVIQVQHEILNLENVKKFIFHPIPCIYQGKNFEFSDVIWLGLKTESDQDLFNKILQYEEQDFRKDDFENSDNILGNLFSFDQYGNLLSNLKNYSQTVMEMFIARNTFQEKNTYYLCSGNYYQSKFISFLETLQDDDYSFFIANILAKRLIQEEFFTEVNVIISITLSSQLLAKAMLKQIKKLDPDKFDKIKFIRLSNYNSFEKEDFFKEISKNDKVLLVCDVISTGFLVLKLKNILEKIDARLLGLSAIVDTRIQTTGKTGVKCHFNELHDITIHKLGDLPINKLKRNQITNFNKYEINRINPITNSTNTLSKSKSYTYKIIFPDSKEVFDLYPELSNFLKIGCFYYNNVFHSYYFETHELLKSKIGEKIISDLIEKLKTEKSVEIDSMEYLFYPIYSGVEVIDHDIYKKKIFKNHTMQIFPVARFITPNGWRFTFPPKFLNDKSIDKNIFILDDGSVSGATITQMIDEICFLGIKSVTFLSIFGRLEDYQREFFSRIEEVMPKYPSSPVPLKIFFGLNWNIPVYTLGVKNPFYRERDKLEKYLNSTSIPPFVKTIMNQRYNELKLYNPSRIRENYKEDELSYLPRYKSTDENIIPIQEIFIIRDIIGKIAGYRFYTEYFNFFDDFINFYNEKKDTKERYKDIELILAVIIHEPHLSIKIKEMLPDVFEKIIEFINLIVIEKRITLEMLYYKWSSQSFIRLFFIINWFDFSEIIKVKKLKRIFKFCEINSSSKSLNYVFYFLFIEIPTFKEDILQKKHARDIDLAMKELINNPNDINLGTLLKIKQFSSVLNSNPFIDKIYDEKESLKILNAFYLEEKNIAFHNDCLESQFGRLTAGIDDCQACLNENIIMKNKINTIKKEWDDIREKVEKFLRCMANIESFSVYFFKGKLHNISHKNDFSIQSILNNMNEILYSKNENWNQEIINKVDHYVNYLIRYLVEDSSDFVRLFTMHQTKIYELWFQFTMKYNQYKFVPKSKNLIVEINFPMHFLIVKDALYEKIFSNFRYASKKHNIYYEWIVSNNEIILEIESTIISEFSNGVNGKPSFKEIEEYYNFSYRSNHTNNKFTQRLEFRTMP